MWFEYISHSNLDTQKNVINYRKKTFFIKGKNINQLGLWGGGTPTTKKTFVFPLRIPVRLKVWS